MISSTITEYHREQGDVSLVVQDGRLNVHTAVLAVSCPRLADLVVEGGGQSDMCLTLAGLTYKQVSN